MRFDREEGIILSLDKGYILISRGLLPRLEEGHIRSNGVELAVADRYAVCVYYNYVGVAHFAHAHKNSRVGWHGLCALNLDVAIGWEASGVILIILDCCRCITGVSCKYKGATMKRRYLVICS